MGTHKNRLGQAVLMRTTNVCFKQKCKKKSPMIFSVVVFSSKNICILHGHVFVMIQVISSGLLRSCLTVCDNMFPIIRAISPIGLSRPAPLLLYFISCFRGIHVMKL